jgi:hypothetical protein
LELPATLAISPIFKVEDLTTYPSSVEDEQVFEDALAPPACIPSHVPPRDQIKAILDDQLVSTRRGGYQKFLIKWKNRPMSDFCWLQTEEVQCLNPDLYDEYLASHSMESSFFFWRGEIDGGLAGLSVAAILFSCYNNFFFWEFRLLRLF